jgi:integrase
VNIVGPIKSEKDIERIKVELSNHSYRDYLLFVLGIDTGIKLSDLLNLKFNQLLKEGQMVSSIHIKNIEYPIKDNVKECFEFYCYKVVGNPSNDGWLYPKG